MWSELLFFRLCLHHNGFSFRKVASISPSQIGRFWCQERLWHRHIHDFMVAQSLHLVSSIGFLHGQWPLKKSWKWRWHSRSWHQILPICEGEMEATFRKLDPLWWRQRRKNNSSDHIFWPFTCDSTIGGVGYLGWDPSIGETLKLQVGFELWAPLSPLHI